LQAANKTRIKNTQVILVATFIKQIKCLKVYFWQLSNIADICNVNFFSHFHFDQLENNPIHNFGLLTPDLLRNFTPNQYNKKKLNELNTQLDWHVGIQKHFARDNNFHKSKFFDSVYNDCHAKTKILFQSLEIPRFWFALHVWIEMLLDKVLIQNSPSKLSTFYTELELVSEHLEALLSQIDHSNIHEFEVRFNRFLESKYLFHYQEHSGIVYGLNRVFIQVKAENKDWNDFQKEKLISLSVQIEESIRNHINLILIE